jgi:hypothetical protein
MKIIFAAIVFLIFPGPDSAAQDLRRDARAISMVKRLSVAKLDKRLRPKAFKPWLQTVVGSSRRIEWELNDCGEQSGTGNQKDFPICVAAMTKLRDGTEVVVMIAVGTHRRGIVGKPLVWFAYFEPKGGRFTEVRRLGDLPKELKKRSRLPKTTGFPTPETK